jgi:hypothetical protein
MAGVPTGAFASFNPASVAVPGSGTVTTTLSVNAPAGTQASTFPLSIMATVHHGDLWICQPYYKLSANNWGSCGLLSHGDPIYADGRAWRCRQLFDRGKRRFQLQRFCESQCVQPAARRDCRTSFHFAPALPRAQHLLTVYEHYVAPPVQIGAATSPSSILSPLSAVCDRKQYTAAGVPAPR